MNERRSTDDPNAGYSCRDMNPRIERPTPVVAAGSVARTAFCLAALVLLGAIGLTVGAALTAVAPAPLDTRLGEAFPANVPEWSSRELPLGPTEVTVEASKEILGFDDYINREYVNGPLKVGVYIAYWKPGKLTARMVRGHVPDNCWVAAGWTMKTPTDPYFTLTDGLRFERRLFEEQQQSFDVVYAHIVDGRVHSFSKGKASGLLDDMMHYWDWHTGGQQEQYFIRISVEPPFDRLKGSQLLAALDSFIRQHVLRSTHPSTQS